MPTTVKRFRRLNIEDAKVGDEIRYRGQVVTILSVVPSFDKRSFRLRLSCNPERTEYFPKGGVLTQPPF